MAQLAGGAVVGDVFELAMAGKCLDVGVELSVARGAVVIEPLP